MELNRQLQRIGLVPGPSDPGPSPAALGRMIQLIDAVVLRHHLPLEFQSIEGIDPVKTGEFAAFLLGNTFSASSWIHQMASESLGATGLCAPFVMPEANRSSFLFWPFEESSKIKAGSRDNDSWIETSSLSRANILGVARKAKILAQERQSEIFWVSSGWGAQEDYAYEISKKELGIPLPLLPIENIQSSLIQPSGGRRVILLAVAKTAVPVARFLGAQGWIAWAERGVALAQGWGKFGPALALSFLLDHLGFVPESLALDRDVATLVQQNEDKNSGEFLELLIGRIKNG